ncbi:MAG: GrpB family protein [Polyangiaceae bacterium]
MSAPIELVDYDPSWPHKFAAERELLRAVIGSWLAGPIEHIGSTAVPGLRAKPVIDIMAGVASLPASRDAIPALAQLQYEYWPYKVELMHWFCKPSDDHRTHHLHLVPIDSDLWRARLAFRDRLRNDATARADYIALKNELANHYSDDREAYTDGKTDFVQRIVAQELARAR